MTSFADQHPRDLGDGTFVRRAHTLPDVTLGTVQLDDTRLTVGERRKLTEHLAALAPDGGTYDVLYTAVPHTAVEQAVVWGVRGAAPKLLWQLRRTDGSTLTVPPFVAKAVTVDDITDEVAVLRFRSNRAATAAAKATDERARRTGRTTGEKLAELREKEYAAIEAHLEADARYRAAAAARALDELAELRQANEPWTNAFDAEQDRLFDADQAGVELAPLSDRVAAAGDAAVHAVAESDASDARLALWLSEEMTRKRSWGWQLLTV
jgi:hypothetical protein